MWDANVSQKGHFQIFPTQPIYSLYFWCANYSLKRMPVVYYPYVNTNKRRYFVFFVYKATENYQKSNPRSLCESKGFLFLENVVVNRYSTNDGIKFRAIFRFNPILLTLHSIFRLQLKKTPKFFVSFQIQPHSTMSNNTFWFFEVQPNKFNNKYPNLNQKNIYNFRIYHFT